MARFIDEKRLRNVKDNTFRNLSAKRRETTNLYVHEEVQEANSIINAGHQSIRVERPSIMVFMDENPLANWAHECRYLLHDAESGELYQEVKANFPPYLVNPPESFKPFHRPVVSFNPERITWRLKLDMEQLFPWRIRKGNRYAILYSGASNNRHTNDLEFLYRQLVDRFYFDEDNITVLNYDGTINYSGGPKPVVNWPGDNTPYTMPVNAAGTKQALEDAIDALKPKLQQDDLLLIHTNNHGGHNGTESYLCTYSGPSYTASDFGSKLAELPNYSDLIVMMEQCHSGGFNDIVIESSTADRTTFAGACTEGKNSIGGADFDPFARDWISSLAGADPYGAALLYDPDYNSSGKVSTREAFAYADDIHNSYDSPVYSAYGQDAGDQHLHQKWSYIFIHRELILSELRTLQLELSDQVKYRKLMRTEILPALAQLDDQLAEKQMETKQAEEMIRKVLGSVQAQKVMSK